ncbi:MAG: polysaccharide deacetylase family protein [Ilumatobacter sp.]|uniref:polysaccharide deacetylase family protein n=1 Tax=Ilumatobacter sp. TaxID=1967498 RepID=UPI00329A1A78
MSIRSLVKRTSPLVDSILRPPPGITILIYHRVGGGTPSAVDLDVDEFRRQLDHLREHHDVIDLDTAVSRLESNEVAPTSGVVLTFDDGTADFCDVVVPELVAAFVPATLYVTTGFVEDPQGFHWDTPAVTWSGLRDAVSTGLVTIGSHSHTHALFDRIGPTQAADEIARSIDAIGDNVGVVAEHFAYPKALRASVGVEPTVRQSFTTAAVARGRVNRPERFDLHRLTRTPIQRDDGPAEFAAKARGGMRLEGELRELVAHRRYRDAVN